MQHWARSVYFKGSELAFFIFSGGSGWVTPREGLMDGAGREALILNT